MNELTISHQDGELKYRLERGGYCIENDRLTWSVQFEAVAQDQFPDCANLCLEGYPLDHPLRAGDCFEHLGGMANDEEEPGATRAHGYFTFHAEEVFLRLIVEEVEGDSVTWRIEAKHDDVDYYDERAKDCPTTGRVTLTRAPRKKLWVPV